MSLPPSCSQSAGETGNEGRAQKACPCGLGLSWTEWGGGVPLPHSDNHLSPCLAATHPLVERHKKMGCSDFQEGDGTTRVGDVMLL